MKIPIKQLILNIKREIIRRTWWRSHYKKIKLSNQEVRYNGRCIMCQAGVYGYMCSRKRGGSDYIPRCDTHPCPCKPNERLIEKPRRLD